MAIHLLIATLIFLIFISAFFSAAETGMMALNRYRLRHLVRKKNRAAKRVNSLLKRTDRLLGVILIGNNFANIFASSIATLLAIRFFGDLGVAVCTALLAIVILIFGEIIPKTLAAIYSQKIAFLVSWPLKLLLSLFYPLVWIVSVMVGGFLRLFRIKIKEGGAEHLLSTEELRTLVYETGTSGKISSNYQDMLLSVLDLEKVTVEDIMIPRNRIVGIDINDDWPKIINQLTGSQYTKLPLYRNNIDQVEGVLHLRRALHLIAENRLNKDTLLQAAEDVYFVPEGTPLNVQLLNFQRQKRRLGLVVDEYGDIQGLVTLEDLLEEIVGEFTTNITSLSEQAQKNSDGSYEIDGAVSVRELNRFFNWELPTDGPRTLSGLIIEYLEMLPNTGIALRLGGYPIEILEVKANKVKLARIWPELRMEEAESQDVERR